MCDHDDSPWLAKQLVRVQSNFDAGDHLTVASLCDRILRRYPECFQARFGRALARIATREYSLALEDLHEAIRLDPTHAQSHSNRACVYTLLGEPDLGLRDANRAIELDPTLTIAYANRAFVLTDLGTTATLERAIADLRIVVEKTSGVDPIQHVEALAAMGFAHAGLGRHEEALPCYTQAVSVMPPAAWVYRLRALSLLAAGRTDRAIEDLDRCLDLDPEDARALSDRARIRVEMGRLADALADFSRALELDPAMSAVWSDRAALHFRLGDFDRARADLARAQQIVDGDVRPEVDFGWQATAR